MTLVANSFLLLAAGVLMVAAPVSPYMRKVHTACAFTARRFPHVTSTPHGFSDSEETPAGRARPFRSTLCLQIADALGPVYEDESFADLFPRRGQPAQALDS